MTIAILVVIGLALLVSQLVVVRWLGRIRVVRAKVPCPVHGREAIVDLVADERQPLVYRDVAGCSLLAPGAPVTCGQTCRSAAVAPFGELLGSPAGS